MSESEWFPEGATSLQQAVAIAVGSASVCWVGSTGDAVFDGEQASGIVDGLVKWIQDREAERHPIKVLEMAEEIYTREEADVEAPHTLEQELAQVLNRHSAENVSDTPDFILAGALVAMLNSLDWTILRRGTWYGHLCQPGSCSHEES